MSTMNEKIRKLMALATHAGTSPEEASAAAAMAAELALKYNIDLEATQAASAPQAKVFEEGEIELWITAQYRQCLINLSAGIADLYGCKTVIHSVNHAKYGIKFIGQPHNVALCNSWLKYLWDSCQRANVSYNKTRSYDSAAASYRAAVTFRLHFSSEVYRRLRDKLEAMRRGDAPGTGTALVVVNWYEAEKKEVAQWMADNMKLGKMAKTRGIRIDGAAAVAGHQAGQRASLADQVGSSGVRHRQLS